MKTITKPVMMRRPYILVLLLMIAPLFVCSTCGDDDDDDDDNVTIPVAEVEAALGAGTWTITYYFDDEDETADFSGYSFVFGADGVLTATKNGVATTGSWDVTASDDDTELVIDLGVADPLVDLNDDWDIAEISDGEIVLEDVSGGSGEVEYLTFTKN